MPIEFTDTTNQRIRFASPTGVHNLDTKTIVFYMNTDDIDGGFFIMKDWYVSIRNPSQIEFSNPFDGGGGVWSAGTINADTEYHIAIRYDRTDVANNPEILVDGVEQAEIERTTPIGTATNETANLDIGNHVAGTQPFDGHMWDVGVYNWMLPDDIINNIINGKIGMQIIKGLVFYCPFIGAKGLQSPNVLGGSNTVYDWIKGYVGTPNQSPVLVADTKLAYP